MKQTEKLKCIIKGERSPPFSLPCWIESTQVQEGYFGKCFFMEIWHLFNHIQMLLVRKHTFGENNCKQMNEWWAVLSCGSNPPLGGGSCVGTLTSFSFHSVSLGVSKVNKTALFPIKISISPCRSLQPGTRTERLLKWFEAELKYWMMCSFIMSKSVRVTSYISDCRTSWKRWNLAEPVVMIWDFIWHFTNIQAAFVFSSVSIQTEAKSPLKTSQIC